jgi:two-component system cell cycle sensor histidine kinase/response regulator CckA
MDEGGVLAEILTELRALRAEQRGGDPDARWMRLVLDHAPDAITVLDPHGVVLYANHLASRGDPQQVIQRDSAELIPDESRARWRAVLRGVAESGRADSCEIESISGYVWYTRLVPITHDGSVTSILCIGTDRTDQRRAERELRRTEEDLRMALEASKVGLWRWNVERDEFVWDAASRALFEPERVGPLRIADYLRHVHPEDRPRVAAALERARTTARWEHMEHRSTPSEDGETRWVLARGRAVTNERGEVTDILGASVDITRVKNLEQQLRQSQKLEAIGQLAGGIAHDFNNLILTIDLNADIAARDTTERDRSLENIRLAAERAAALTKQLLAFGRRQAYTMSAIDVQATIEDTLRLLRRVLPETIQIDFIPAQSLPRAQADRSGLEQILTNLCLNARDAMPNGGRLTIEVENVLVNGTYQESHPWAQPGRYVLLVVSDTGCGMAPEVRDRIFEPFFTTKEPGMGTGLGLSTVYGIVKQHDGMIHVYTELGRGTTFKVYLPVAERSAAEVRPKITSEPPGGTETILVVEDEPMLREIVSRVLERAGYTIITAADGEEAFTEFCAHRGEIALVLLDSVMPRKSGVEALKEIRSVDPDVPVILSSGYTDAWAAIEPSLEGVPLLEKPYDPDELVRVVRLAIDRRAG